MTAVYVGPAFADTTVRELLERVAGITHRWPSPEPFEHVLHRWNPAENSADAFALQVELELTVLGTTARAGNGACAILQGDNATKEQDARLAVVWAAAHCLDAD